MTATSADMPARHAAQLRRGRLLEVATLGWNVVGIVVLTVAAVISRSIAWPDSVWTR